MNCEQSVQEFLRTKSRFPNVYKLGMEVQVNVKKPGQSFRLPQTTRSASHVTSGSRAEFNSPINYRGIEAIGLSGWDYQNKVSRWVGFDFDVIATVDSAGKRTAGHKKGLTADELQEILRRSREVPWITIRRSTSGAGLHLYVPIAKSPDVPSRKLHARLARAILSNLSGLLGFDFSSKVDTCGQILWIYHTRATSNGFEIIHLAKENLAKVPADWKEEKYRGKVHELTINRKNIKLSSNQERLLQWFAKQSCTWWWDSEANMLVAHTYDLGRAHNELKLRGIFRTSSTGSDCPNDQNCFAFPLRSGSWIVRRHTPGTPEDPYWKTDKSGWTYCYYDRIPTLEDLAPVYGGMLNQRGEYVFGHANSIKQVFEHLAPTIKIIIPQWAAQRQFRVKAIKGNRLVIVLERSEGDDIIPGWISNRRTWEKVINIVVEDYEIQAPDSLVRHVVTNDMDSGWFLNSRSGTEDRWINEPKSNIVTVLTSLGNNPNTVNQLMGQSILNPWELVTIPFGPEYPGDRKWNKYNIKLNYSLCEGDYSRWMDLLTHIGTNLDGAVKENVWCAQHHITTGGHYLKLWLSSIFQYPLDPVPYLFLYGPQLSGKSTFHESISLLLDSGVVQADHALTNQQGFNAELAGAILCVIEETDLRKSKYAFERVKNWVTSKRISLHEKGKTPFDLDNTTHWLQCANSPTHCPIQFGDTRIVMCYVDRPATLLSKEQLFSNLAKQAGEFLWELFNCRIPDPVDRLRIPVIDTAEKREEELASANEVERFIEEECQVCLGDLITFMDFADQFHLWIKSIGGQPYEWSKNKISRMFPMGTDIVKGRFEGCGGTMIGNLKIPSTPGGDHCGKFVRVGERLVLVNEQDATTSN